MLKYQSTTIPVIEGLSAETIQAAKLRRVTASEISALVGFTVTSGGFVIPYDNAFCRVRLDTPHSAPGWEKPAKYLSPRGSQNHLYIPPTLAPDVLTDPTKALVITEGEKKALKAVQEGIPCVAVAGIWAWLEGQEEGQELSDAQRLLPDFDRIAWRKRRVYLVYDSDITPSHPGFPAFERLARVLEARGAMCSIHTLPGDGEAKVGLDDYLLTHSPKDFWAWAQSISTPTQYPEPEPLELGFSPTLPPFDALKLLPHPLGTWAEDTAERMNAPVEFVATAALIATAGVVGNRVLVAPDPEANPGWLEAPNLWGLLVGEPGTKKSPVMEAAFKPLHRLEADLHQENQRARDAWELDRRNRKKGDPVTEDDLRPPAERALLAHDITPEKLADLLEYNVEGLVGFQDELLGLVATWERPEKAGERQFYLKLWNGLSPHTVRRIQRGSHFIPICTLSLIGGVQPGPLGRYIAEAAKGWSNDGLLHRFQLLVQAELPEYRRVVRPPNTLGAAYSELLENLYATARQDLGLPLVELRSGVARPLFTFDPEAQGLYLQWLEQTAKESRQASTPTLKRSLLEKQAGLVPKLALLLHLVEHPIPPRHIGQVSTMRAIALANLYRAHTLKVWWNAIQPEVEGAALIAIKILQRTKSKAAFNYERFSIRDISRARWKGLTDTKVVERALAELEARGWVLRQGSAWIPNPRVWEA